MAEYSVNRPLQRAPVHPGEILREDVLPSLELSVSEAARRLGVFASTIASRSGLYASDYNRNGT